MVGINRPDDLTIITTKKKTKHIYAENTVSYV